MLHWEMKTSCHVMLHCKLCCYLIVSMIPRVKDIRRRVFRMLYAFMFVCFYCLRFVEDAMSHTYKTSQSAKFFFVFCHRVFALKREDMFDECESWHVMSHFTFCCGITLHDWTRRILTYNGSRCMIECVKSRYSSRHWKIAFHVIVHVQLGDLMFFAVVESQAPWCWHCTECSVVHFPIVFCFMFYIASHLAIFTEMTCLVHVIIVICPCHPWCHIALAYPWHVFIVTCRFMQDVVPHWVEHDSHASTMHHYCVARRCVAFVQWACSSGWLHAC